MSDIEQTYRATIPVWHRLEDEARFILNAALGAENVKVHSLLSRTKTLESIRAKATRGNIADPLESLDDLVGIRVVCLLRSDIARIGQAIGQAFHVLSEDNKLDGANVEVFGYQSVHFVVQLHDSCAGPRYAGLHNIRVEIQVRTLAMDAWAALSHYLDYKSEPDVPKALRKDFYALSGLFYVADTHFEFFYTERQKSKIAADQVVGVPSSGQELNLDTLTAYLHRRYPDRAHSESQGVSELVSELASAGYVTLDKLHEALDASQEAFKNYEAKRPPGNKMGLRFHDVGVVRISVGIFDVNYAGARYPQDELLEDSRKYLPGIRELR